MANKTHKNMGFKLDSAAGTITAIGTYLNQQTLSRAVDMLEDEGMGQEERTFLPGLAGTTVAINGFVNTTTDGIFGPLVSDNTSITKTFEFQSYTGRYYNGEAWVNQVEYSGARDSLQTFSANLTITGAVNRTSAALP